MSETALRFGEAPPGAARRRALALALVVLVHALMGYLLFMLAPAARQKIGEIVAMETRNIAAERTAEAPTPEQEAAPPRPREAKPTPPPPLPPSPLSLTFGPQFDEPFDLAKIPNRRAERAQNARASTDSQPVGVAPNGQPLYNAEWLREPTRAEMITYLPTGLPDGSYGEIFCRIVRGYRVEDCQELDESPRGSRLSSGLREAAWQFRVRPPRRGGEPMWDTWVRIRYSIYSSNVQVETR